MTDLKGKQLASLLFHHSRSNIDAWECESSKKNVKRGGSGLTNLCAHVSLHHKEEVAEVLVRDRTPNNISFRCPTHSEKTRHVHAWMECIALCILPFNFCENPIIRKQFKQSGVCRNTLVRYIHELCKNVENRVRSALPEMFAIVFDGWSDGSTHYVAVFATYPFSNDAGFDEFLFAC